MQPAFKLLLCLALPMASQLHAQTSAQSTPQSTPQPTLQSTAQTPAKLSGQIAYEMVRKVDPAGIKIVINGEEVKPGDPNFPTDLPDTHAYSQKLSFSGNFAKELREEQNMMIKTVDVGGPGGGPGGGAPVMHKPPFEEQVFIDLEGAKTITLLTVGKDPDTKIYRADAPIKRAGSWQFTDQLKMIAGYNCRKVNVTYKKEIYKVWYTLDLPFNYSPIPDLTPKTGVVLLIESSKEQAKAMKVTLSPVAAKDLQPDPKAQSVTPDQLKDLREKAMADFQQQMMQERN